MQKMLIGFFFETGDSSCQYYEVWVVAENNDWITYDSIHNVIDNEPYCDLVLDEDGEYEDIIEKIMKDVGYKWNFAACPLNEITGIMTYFL